MNAVGLDTEQYKVVLCVPHLQCISLPAASVLLYFIAQAMEHSIYKQVMKPELLTVPETQLFQKNALSSAPEVSNSRKREVITDQITP